MPPPAITRQQALAALAAGQARQEQGRDSLAGLSMDELAALAGISRATLYRLFGSQQQVLQEMGVEPPPIVRSRVLDTALDMVGRHGLGELSMDMEGRVGLLLQLLFEVSRSGPGSHAGAGFQEDAANAMRTLPLVTGYLDQQMAAGRLRRMDPLLAVQALVGPIVMHLLMRAPAESQSGPGHGETVPVGEVADELAGIWLRAMTPARVSTTTASIAR